MALLFLLFAESYETTNQLKAMFTSWGKKAKKYLVN